ncbi:MAG: hypothetical protein NZ826_06920 [Thermodesulfovibrio sp.]|nr:hypothetical protein [Thermodesulfovibrio sp.]
MVDSELIKTVRYNCDVSDAHYWGYFSICNLLLRLRELFRVEKGLEPWESIKNDEILPWIEKKEQNWKVLENAELIPIKINDRSYSPFDIEEINKIIVDNGLVYGAGYALFLKPSFFIGLIQRCEKIDGYDVYFINKEFARDIFSSPGMSIKKNIFIRLVDIKNRLWENLDSWSNKNKATFQTALSEIGNLEEWRASFNKFKKIVEKYAKFVLYHEIAEQEESNIKWNEIIKNCNTSKTEHILRGVNDFIADFSPKGPVSRSIIEQDRELLALYILSQGVYKRRLLKVTLQQIEKALASDNWQKIEEIRFNEFIRWKNLSEKIIEIFNTEGFEGVKKFTDKIFEGGMH